MSWIAPRLIKSPKRVHKPEWAKRGSSRGSARRGLAYEGKVGKKLRHRPGLLLAGPWFSYIDEKEELRYCQPDFIYDAGAVLWVVEVKLSWVPEAEIKLRGLYGPIVAELTGRRPQLLTIVKNLRKGCPAPKVLDQVLTMKQPQQPILAQWSPE